MEINQETKNKITEWTVTHDLGLSSICLATKMLGIEPKSINHPHDPADFYRCLTLILDVPELRPRLIEMSELCLEWRAIIQSWDQIEKSLLKEVPNWLKGDFSGKAPETYKLMATALSHAENYKKAKEFLGL